MKANLTEQFPSAGPALDRVLGEAIADVAAIVAERKQLIRDMPPVGDWPG